MAKKPRASLKSPTSTVYDPANAPIIYFDGAPCYGSSGGIVHVTLAAGRHLLEENQVAVDAVAVAFLRCSIPAAKSLKEALERALLMATPRTEGGGN